MENKPSERIKQRLNEANVDYKSNDNISEYIKEGELDELQDEVKEKVEGVLQSLVIDTENDHNTNETARRVAKMFLRETFKGRYENPPKVTTFPNKSYQNLYTSGPISIRSTCAHHLQNITGKCWIGVVPEIEVIGLSKFNRIIHHIAERPQIQEEMTMQIADSLKKFTNTSNIAVLVKAEHQCMTARGVREHESIMSTAVMHGAFQEDPALKQEFYDILKLNN